MKIIDELKTAIKSNNYLAYEITQYISKHINQFDKETLNQMIKTIEELDKYIHKDMKSHWSNFINTLKYFSK